MIVFNLVLLFIAVCYFSHMYDGMTYLGMPGWLAITLLAVGYILFIIGDSYWHALNEQAEIYSKYVRPTGRNAYGEKINRRRRAYYRRCYIQRNVGFWMMLAIILGVIVWAICY